MKAFSKTSKHNLIFFGVTLACLIVAGSGSAFAVNQKHTGKAVAGVTVVTENETSFIGSTSFQNLPGATATITVPDLKTQLVVVEFSADSTCTGPFGGNWCSVQILADGVEMGPVAAGDFAFDGVGGGPDDFFEAHAMQRNILLGPGKHTILVQASVTLAGMGFFLDDWSLAVTQYNNGK